MPPDPGATARERYDAGFAPLRRFLPYLWPAHAPELKARVLISLLLVLVAKGVQIGTTYLLSGAVQNALNMPSEIGKVHRKPTRRSIRAVDCRRQFQ